MANPADELMGGSWTVSLGGLPGRPLGPLIDAEYCVREPIDAVLVDSMDGPPLLAWSLLVGCCGSSEFLGGGGGPMTCMSMEDPEL